MLRITTIAFMTLLGAAAFAGCSEDDSTVLGQQGETCERAADCAKGLGCYNGTCQLSDSEVTVSTKQCKAIQCTAAADCCNDAVFTRGASCDTYDTECAADATSVYCTYAASAECVCNTSTYSCNDNQCQSLQCTVAADCDSYKSSSCDTYETECAADPTSTYCDYVDEYCSYSCITGRCVQTTTCTTDADCDSGYSCSGGICTELECEESWQCGAMQACQSNVCVDVGCATDRECMIDLGTPLATCDTTASPPTCTVACTADAECADALNNELAQCVNGSCQRPGCETDDECKIALEGTYSTASGYRAACL